MKNDLLVEKAFEEKVLSFPETSQTNFTEEMIGAIKIDFSDLLDEEDKKLLEQGLIGLEKLKIKYRKIYFSGK